MRATLLRPLGGTLLVLGLALTGCKDSDDDKTDTGDTVVSTDEPLETDETDPTGLVDPTDETDDTGQVDPTDDTDPATGATGGTDETDAETGETDTDETDTGVGTDTTVETDTDTDVVVLPTDTDTDTDTGIVDPSDSDTDVVGPTDTDVVGPTDSDTDLVGPTDSDTDLVGPTDSDTDVVGPTDTDTGAPLGPTGEDTDTGPSFATGGTGFDCDDSNGCDTDVVCDDSNGCDTDPLGPTGPTGNDTDTGVPFTTGGTGFDCDDSNGCDTDVVCDDSNGCDTDPLGPTGNDTDTGVPFTTGGTGFDCDDSNGCDTDVVCDDSNGCDTDPLGPTGDTDTDDSAPKNPTGDTDIFGPTGDDTDTGVLIPSGGPEPTGDTDPFGPTGGPDDTVADTADSGFVFPTGPLPTGLPWPTGFPFPTGGSGGFDSDTANPFPTGFPIDTDETAADTGTSGDSGFVFPTGPLPTGLPWPTGFPFPTGGSGGFDSDTANPFPTGFPIDTDETAVDTDSAAILPTGPTGADTEAPFTGETGFFPPTDTDTDPRETGDTDPGPTDTDTDRLPTGLTDSPIDTAPPIETGESGDTGTTPEFVSPTLGVLKRVPAGGYIMGCVTGRDDGFGTCNADEEPDHPVVIGHDLWVMEGEVSQGAWQTLTGVNPSYFSAAGGGPACGDACPVETITWHDALVGANAASAAEGLPPCYALGGCSGNPGDGFSCTDVTITSWSGLVEDCPGYRLPTEAEREYVSRGSTSFAFAGSDDPNDVAWFADDDTCLGLTGVCRTHPSCEKDPNGFGLCDLSGNVWEWVQDGYDATYYGISPVDDPPGPATGFTERVYRGGAYSQEAFGVRNADRAKRLPEDRNRRIGTRYVRTVDPAPEPAGTGDTDTDVPLPLLQDFVRIPAGSFIQGCVAGRDDVAGGCIADEEPSREVVITSDFLLSQAEITQGTFRAVTGSTPSFFSPGGGGRPCGEDCPVEQVNFWDAARFANLASVREGYATCYTLVGCTGTAGVDLTCTDLVVNTPSGSPYACEGYRLPTEAEWEYAARAGQDLPYASGTEPDGFAWYWGDPACKTGSGICTPHPICQLQRNPFGLCDMSGNIYEWTFDRYDADYYSTTDDTPGDTGPAFDPYGPDVGDERTRHGGWAGSIKLYVRVAFRAFGTPDFRSERVGLRLARTAP